MKVFEYTHGEQFWYSEYGGFYMLAVYPTKDGKTLRQTVKHNTCREFFTMKQQDFIRRKVDAATNKAYALLTNAAPSSKAALGAEWLNKVKTGVLILNAFEKHYGIPLTKVYPVNIKKSHNWSGKCFIVGSKRWTQSRYSFGIWTIFFRIAYDNSLFRTTSMKKLLPKMKWPEICDRIASSKTSNTTINQARRFLPIADKFFAFEKRHLKDRYANWDPALISNGMARPEGIFKLVSGNSNSLKLKDLWRQFDEKWKRIQKRKETV